jgi:nucleoside-triphosphatase THEP1
MNVFLTGKIQTGKSVAIRRFLDSRPTWRLGGFRTISVYGRTPGAYADTYIQPARGDAPLDREHLVGIRWGRGRFDAFPAVFDAVGVSYLDCPACDLILMDEIGRMENDAALFRNKILELLDGPGPVLGVVKALPEHTPLLDAVREHPKTRLIEVTEVNRNDVPALIAALLESKP